MAPCDWADEASAMDESAPERNVTFAVNYELSIVDQFLDSQRKRRSDIRRVQSVPSDTEEAPAAAASGKPNGENNAPNVGDARVTIQSPDSKRRSVREKKKDVTLSRSRVRYDMQLVPFARRNRSFLQQFPIWWMPAKQQRRSSRFTDEGTPSTAEVGSLAPFGDDCSVLWIPQNRMEWDDTISEMTAVCTTAAIQRFKSATSTSKPFHAPLSRDYIRDRVDIDDPLHGFQIRHKTGGWLQGFITWTNFTTWTHGFHWDSLHAMSGFTADATAKVDADGSLANELEAETRAGDPHVGGIVFTSIAEIALLGGLGCGEYLLRLALDSIRAEKKYKYVVLQATDQSKTFYDRFGFVRVGAICKYGLQANGEEVPTTGYRHWTHANESELSLQLHGGPSYMMCLKLPDCTSADVESSPFVERMMSLAVEQKPTVDQLGGTLTPGPKAIRRSSTGGESMTGESLFGVPKRRHNPGLQHPGTKRKTPASATKPQPDGVKRRKLNNGSPEGHPDWREQLLSRPPEGAAISFAQNQYQSVWLAVPPASANSKNGRMGPRARDTMSPTLTPKKPSSKKTTPRSGKAELTADGQPRNFYSVRGSDGRFITVSSPLPPAAFLAPAPTMPLPADSIIIRSLGLGRSDGKPSAINKTELMKQKVKSYPRSRLHYYNRVVKPKKGPCSYFFVVHYEEALSLIRIAPMEARGTMSGKREGRPRFQLVLSDTDANFSTCSTSDYEIVPATMVMKTPVLANEAWDVEDDGGE